MEELVIGNTKMGFFYDIPKFFLIGLNCQN